MTPDQSEATTTGQPEEMKMIKPAGWWKRHGKVLLILAVIGVVVVVAGGWGSAKVMRVNRRRVAGENSGVVPTNRVPRATPAVGGGGLACLTGVAVSDERAVAGNEAEIAQNLEEIEDVLGISIIFQLFDRKSTEADWIAYFLEAKKQGAQVLAAVTDSDYVPAGCTQANGERCVLGPERRFLEAVRDNPDVFDGVLYGFLLIDEPYKDIGAEQLRWMYEDAKAIVDVPIVVGWSRQLWKFGNNPKGKFSDGMCDICLISSLEFRDYGEGPFFDRETLIANHLASRQMIREADPEAKILTSIQVFGSARSGSSYYMPSAPELQEMVDILFSDELQAAGELDGVVWQTWKAITEQKVDSQDNLSDDEFEDQREIVRAVCGKPVK